MKWPFYFHYSYDTLRCGLGPGANLWKAFPNGGTYCRSSETFYVKPTKKKACLGDFIATLVCLPGRGYCHLPSKCIKEISPVISTPFLFTSYRQCYGHHQWRRIV